MAYFTLAAHLVARESLTKRTGRASPNVIPAILPARLALDRSQQGQGLGAELLWDAISRAVAANRQAAARLVVVDAIDERAASFYEHFGFEPIPDNPTRLVQKMSSIEAALNSGALARDARCSSRNLKMHRSWQHPWQRPGRTLRGMMPPKLVLSIAEAAEVLGVSDDLIYELTARGELPCLRLGRRKVIPTVAIQAVIDGTLEGFPIKPRQ